MKLNNTTVKRFARDLFKRKQQATNPQLIQPRRDWFIGLAFGMVILIGIMAWSAYMYVTNRSGEQLQATDTASPLPTYRAAIVAEALEYFAAKEAAFRNLESSTVYVPPVEEPPVVVATSTQSSEVNIDATTASSSPERVDLPEAEPVDEAALELSSEA